MAITAQDLLTELGYTAWSGYNADDMVFDSDDSKQARIELNNALMLLYNSEDFPPLMDTKTIETDNATYLYSMPNGQIQSIYNQENGQELIYAKDNSTLDKELKGKPTHYWIQYKNLKAQVRLYPIPDDIYYFDVIYKDFMPVLSADRKTRKCQFEQADDIINMSDKPDNAVVTMFKNCLIAKTIVNSIIDEQDENYRPMITKFNEYWKVFKKSCKPVKSENRVIW